MRRRSAASSRSISARPTKRERINPRRNYCLKSQRTYVSARVKVVDEKINFKVDVVRAMGLPPHFCKDVYV